MNFINCYKKKKTVNSWRLCEFYKISVVRNSQRLDIAIISYEFHETGLGIYRLPLCEILQNLENE